MHDVSSLSDLDGYNLWREKMFITASQKFQENITKTQNPLDCDDADFLICDIELKGTGLASELYNLILCLQVAKERRLVVISQSYGWLKMLLPLIPCFDSYETLNVYAPGKDNFFLALRAVDFHI